jgi:4-aminobutyrate aminotransferase
MAKGLASGVPLSAIASRTDLTETQQPGSMGGTYAGNILACASACATVDVILEERLCENSELMGKRLRAGLHKLQASGKYPIKDVRGLGLMVGVEFERSCDKGTAGAVAGACLDEGMMLLTTSAWECVRFIPPLVATTEEIDLGLEKFEAALNAVFHG